MTIGATIRSVDSHAWKAMEAVGRERELRRLEAGLADMLAGKGRLFLIRGAAGIGKTRIAEELGARAMARGARLLRAQCWEEAGAPPFWPWVEVFRELVAHRPDLPAPDFHRGSSAPAALFAFEGRHDDFALFDSAASALKRASANEPIVIVLDDVHAADYSSLRMLRFLAGELREAQILVICTRRDHEAKPPAAELLDEIGRDAETIHLGPLSETESSRIVEGVLAAPVAKHLLAEIYRATEGNPLFIHEVLRLGVSRSEANAPLRKVEIPPRLRDVIRRRIDSLSGEVIAALGVASVIGRDFDVASLTVACGLPSERALELLAEAVDAGVVSATPRSVGRYRFSHALVRETLHDDLPAARRAEAHARIATSLEDIRTAAEVIDVAKLAHHYFEVACVGGDRQKAIEYATRAADHALRSFAYQEAGELYERALGLVEESGSRDDALRCELLLSLGSARSKAGDTPAARESFLAAAELARRLADERRSTLLARAALGLGGVWLVTGIGVADEALRELLEEALAELPQEDGALRARLFARLAAELRWSAAEDHRDVLSSAAIEMARRLGDVPTLAQALIGRYWALWGPDNVEERLGIATEIVELGAAAADDTMALAGHTWRLAAELELGDIVAVDRDFDAALRLAEKIRQPYFHWWSGALQTMRGLLAGRLDVAERLAGETLALGGQVEARDAVPAYGVQMATLRREQGRLAELEESLKVFVAEYPEVPAWRCALAFLYMETGDASAARRGFEPLASQDLRDIPRDQQWLTAVSLLGEVSVFLGDRRRASLCYDLLLPYAARNVVLGSASAFYGSVAHFLGLLAAFLSNPTEAAKHFEAALAMNARMGARPSLARTQLEYARLLLARGLAGDAAKARDLLAEARSTARALGIHSLEQKLAALSAEPAEVAAEKLPSFHLEGDYWAIAYNGGVVRVRDTKGLRYLEYLVRHPGRELHALDIASGIEQGEVASATNTMTARRELRVSDLRIADLGDAGEVIDGRAKQEYRRRLRELEAELEQATEDNDVGRAAKLRAELEALTTELAGAYGLGGRGRRGASQAEKARVNITKTIQGAIERIGAESSGLAAHLTKTVRTGTFFCYRGVR